MTRYFAMFRLAAFSLRQTLNYTRAWETRSRRSRKKGKQKRSSVYVTISVALETRVLLSIRRDAAEFRAVLRFLGQLNDRCKYSSLDLVGLVSLLFVFIVQPSGMPTLHTLKRRRIVWSLAIRSSRVLRDFSTSDTKW